MSEAVKTMDDVEEIEFTPEDDQAQLKQFEGDILGALLGAASYAAGDETYNMRVIRDKTVLFTFRVRPLAEEEYDKCRTQNTTYVRNKNVGVKVPEKLNRVRYRSQLIYTATIPEDRAKIWDNKEAWIKLNVASGVDLIDKVLKGGEKDAILEQLDKISGFEGEIEEIVKN